MVSSRGCPQSSFHIRPSPVDCETTLGPEVSEHCWHCFFTYSYDLYVIVEAATRAGLESVFQGSVVLLKPGTKRAKLTFPQAKQMPYLRSGESLSGARNCRQKGTDILFGLKVALSCPFCNAIIQMALTTVVCTKSP